MIIWEDLDRYKKEIFFQEGRKRIIKDYWSLINNDKSRVRIFPRIWRERIFRKKIVNFLEFSYLQLMKICFFFHTLGSLWTLLLKFVLVRRAQLRVERWALRACEDSSVNRPVAEKRLDFTNWTQELKKITKFIFKIKVKTKDTRFS